MTFKSVLFKEKCVIYITSCYICYICKLHPLKSLISLLIHSSDKLLMHIFDHNTMTQIGNHLVNSKLQIDCVYHRNCKSYKLLRMMTLNKMYYKVKDFFIVIEQGILSVSL